MARTKTSSDLELLVSLRRDGDEPLHRQLEQELRVAIRSGRLAAGSALPSTRALAGSLGLSRGVVVEAYEQLVAEGYLVTRAGGTTTIAPSAVPSTPHVRTVPPPEPEIAFRYGRPDVSEFPRAAWMRSLRRVLADAPNERLSYVDDRGVPELREALADYLNRVRGTCAHAEQIVVCSGFAQGISLVAQLLREGRHRTIALEDPSDDTPRAIAAANDIRVAPVPVDECGIVPSALARMQADAVVVTAAHQFPLGGVLLPDRRAQLLAWAADGDRLIVEDDYDAEYRYDRDPIGAIQGLSPDRVAYIGSASKTLAPGLRLGWMVLPPRLVEPIAALKHTADRGSPTLDQLAFADFLARGELDRHLRRMRPIYRSRRDRLLDALGTHLPDLRPVGASAGLHVLAWLPPDVDEGRLVRAAASLGVGVEGLAPYRIRPGGSGGLIFGYANLRERAIEDGVRRLATAVDQVRRSGDRSRVAS
jgi:GntR family transcriptional regulator/MocR family aminotransferase